MRFEFPKVRQASTSVIAVAALAAGLSLAPTERSLIPLAQAQTHEDGTSGHDGSDGGGRGGHEDDSEHTHIEGEDEHEGGKGRGGGHDEDGHDEGGTEGSGGSGYRGGGDGGGDGQGARHGQDADGTGGNRPVWAREGIPEVELGRLNVARSPDRVLDRAYAEALANFTVEVAEFYNMSLEDALDELRDNFENATFIDSPLQNLALMRDALDGGSVLNTLDEVSNDNDTLLAMFLGTASDKTIPISPETAYATAAILGFTLSEEEATDLARDAEEVRKAILAGHG